MAIVTHNSAACVPACLMSLREQRRELPHNVVVLDNASSDGSAEAASAVDPEVEVVRSETNIGFGRANNAALAGRREPYVALVNPDCELGDGCLRRAIDYLERYPDVGLLGARLHDARGQYGSGDKLFSNPWREITGLIDSDRWLRVRIKLAEWWWLVRGRGPARPTEWVVGAFMVLPRRVWNQVGGFDPDFFMFGEDTDLCWRVRRKGYYVAIHPGIEVTHVGGHSTGPAFGQRRRERLIHAHVLAYAKRSRPGGAGRLVRAMRFKLRCKLFLYDVRQRLMGDPVAGRRRRRAEEVLAIVDRVAVELSDRARVSAPSRRGR
ncbi:MAG: glycosyltransferase family 2 protein [bacterium]